jgi:glycosyltransferase involved in cell wall biosynthesis
MATRLVEQEPLAAAVDSDLEATLEVPLPAAIPAGRPTAVFCFGTCFHRRQAIERLEIAVDGVPHRPTAWGMPRLDLFHSLHPSIAEGEESSLERDPLSSDDPECRSYRSGFWATVPIGARAFPGTVELRALAQLADGRQASAPLGWIELSAPAPPASPAADPTRAGLIAVCMATFNPDPELFRIQVDSIRDQTHDDWICLISDDCSSPEGLAAIMREVDGDERFLVSSSERRVGFYRNFERALSLVPPEAELVALSDQDDRWHPEKLEVLRGAIGKAQLVYSDQRLVDSDGRVLAETYWTQRRNNHTNLASLLMANTITGAASLFRRPLLELVLPFPETPGEQYHDHWIGLVALATGRVAYVDRPLYDYVQHGSAALGHSDANLGFQPGERGGLRRLRGWQDSFEAWQRFYFDGFLRLQALGEVLLARCSRRISRGKRRSLRRCISSDRSPLRFAWLALRPRVRKLAGRDETLGAESLLVRGIAWRHVLALRARGLSKPDGRLKDDARMPSARGHGPLHGNAATADLERRVAPLELSISDQAPERVNLLIPTIDLKHLFGGYIAKYNLARKLAETGLRVRIVAVDPTPTLPPRWQEKIESYSGLNDTFKRVEVAFARDRDRPLEVNPNDRFIATTWWTAHLANEAIGETERTRFLYLIQEYEPYTFVMGSWAAAAMTTYEFPHVAVFSTEMLRAFFRQRGYGVFAAGSKEGDRRSTSFQNAITAVEPPTAEELAGRSSRRLLFYARPAQHAARNMFELGLTCLVQAVEQGVFAPGWEFHGVGAVTEGRIPLTDAEQLILLPRQGQREYADLLPRHDVGLSLMFTPHPSLVPIEMASAGMLAVTNRFETKTAAALGEISPNLITVGPSREAIVEGLGAAVAAAEDYQARVAGAAVDWSRDWEQSFNEEVMRRILALLGDC